MGPLFYVINTFNLKERFFSKFFTSHFKCVKCIFFEFQNEGGRKEMRKIEFSVMVVAFSLALSSLQLSSLPLSSLQLSSLQAYLPNSQMKP